MEKSFEMVLDKAKYSYDKKDSTFKQIKPVCKEGTLGNLVGPDDADLWDTLTYKAYENKGVVSLKDSSDSTVKYDYDDDSFPVGFWADSDNESQKILGGYRLTSKDIISRTIRYDGSCLMKDYYSLLNKDVRVLKDMDETLTALYASFQGIEGKVDEKKMLNDIRAVDCDELSMYDGLVKINVEDFKESSGNIAISFAKRTCNVSFNIRYAFEQDDCKAAFEDFKNNRDAEEKFNFDDYAFDVTYSGDNGAYCLDYLILELMEEKGIDTKRIKSRNFAHGIVKMVVKGMSL